MGTESDLKVRTDTLEVWQGNTVRTTQHKKEKKKKESGAKQFPTKDSKHMETWHSSERNKICKHAQGKSAGGYEIAIEK